MVLDVDECIYRSLCIFYLVVLLSVDYLAYILCVGVLWRYVSWGGFVTCSFFLTILWSNLD